MHALSLLAAPAPPAPSALLVPPHPLPTAGAALVGVADGCGGSGGAEVTNARRQRMAAVRVGGGQPESVAALAAS
jgi:hypothetical protein